MMPGSRAARRARQAATVGPRADRLAFRPRDEASDDDTVDAPSATRLAREGPDGRPDPAANAPVILLTYAYAGGGQVQELVNRDPALACTSGTGILAACLQAALAWRLIEGIEDDKPLTRLAAASVRALATGMLTAITGRTGARRWCETVTVEPDSAETFLEVFPATRFLCVHRCCPDVIFSVTRANPWGLAEPGFAAYTVTHPASTVAALAAWWANYAGAMLAFEKAHPESCLRVRYEDLVRQPDKTAAAIRAFLHLDSGPATAGLAAGAEQPAFDGWDLGAPGCGAQMPVDQLPPQLAARVNAMHNHLGYPPLPTPVPGDEAAPPAAASPRQTATDIPNTAGGNG
jgi:hypothetical protein